MSNKSFWPYGIIIFFLVIAGFNFFFVYKAVKSDNGKVEKDYYEKAQKYQEIIDLKKASQKLGWRDDLKVSREQIHFNLFDQNNNELKELNVELQAINLSKDQEINIDRLNYTEKNYSQRVNLNTGKWVFKIKATNPLNNLVFYKEYNKFLVN